MPRDAAYLMECRSQTALRAHILILRGMGYGFRPITFMLGPLVKDYF
jgi:hypothetical protein